MNTLGADKFGCPPGNRIVTNLIVQSVFAAWILTLSVTAAAQNGVAATAEFQNRWYRVPPAEPPTATAFFGGHVGGAFGGPDVPSGPSVTVVRSQFGVAVAGGAAQLTDSDGDGLPDAWELAHGLDPHDDGSTNVSNGWDGDPDGDGFTNGEEFEAQTDPQDQADSPFPPVAIMSVNPGAALVVGGSPITVSGQHFSAQSTVFVNDRACLDIAFDAGTGALSGVVPPGGLGPAVVRVEDPISDSEDEVSGQFVYMAEPFDAALDQSPGVVRTWTEEGVTVVHGYLPDTGSMDFTTPEGIVLTVPTALRASFAAGFIIIRSAANLATLFPAEPPGVQPGFIVTTPAFDIGGLVDTGSATLEIDEPFAEAVTALLPVLLGHAEDTTHLGEMETHLDEVLAPFIAVEPVIAAGDAPLGTDPIENTVTFEIHDFTTYVGLTAYHPADVNTSGAVDAVDVQLVINAALGLEVPCDCDIDGSEDIDAIDVQMVINAALGLW